MRGFRIISESDKSGEAFYSDKPSEVFLRLNELYRFIGSSFPELIVMEYLPGTEYTVDLLNAGEITVVPRKRDSIRSGITFDSTTDYNEEIIKYSRKLAEETRLKYAFGFQFKLDSQGVPKLIEANPRIQGTMVLATLAGANIIYGAVKHALGETVPSFSIQWGIRLLRYWGALGLKDDKTLGEI
jgi:carbamoyl-phosphate synthase large subunit